MQLPLCLGAEPSKADGKQGFVLAGKAFTSENQPSRDAILVPFGSFPIPGEAESGQARAAGAGAGQEATVVPPGPSRYNNLGDAHAGSTDISERISGSPSGPKMSAVHRPAAGERLLQGVIHPKKQEPTVLQKQALYTQQSQRGSAHSVLSPWHPL